MICFGTHSPQPLKSCKFTTSKVRNVSQWVWVLIYISWQTYIAFTFVLKVADLHFIKQFSLLQFILFFLFHLICVAFLNQEELLSNLVVDAVHLLAQVQSKHCGKVLLLCIFSFFGGWRLTTPTFLNILGPPSCALSNLIHLLDIALLKPILPKGSFCIWKHTKKLNPKVFFVCFLQLYLHCKKNYLQCKYCNSEKEKAKTKLHSYLNGTAGNTLHVR